MPYRSPRDWPGLLVPFDGSCGAEQVLRRACRVTRRDGDRLLVLCVAQPPPSPENETEDAQAEMTAMLALTRAQEICRAEGAVADFQLSHSRSLPDAILGEARRSGAAVICLTLKAHELGETALMSETVQSVLASAPCSVLLDSQEAELPPLATPT